MTQKKKEDVGKAKVLIADDASTMRQLMKSMLKDMGFTNILEAKDGVETLKMLNMTRFNLILCDWEMPGNKGDDILEYVRSSDLNKNAIFIMCTGSNNPEKVKKSISLGVSNFITKPFNPKILFDKVGLYFNLKRS